MKKTVLLLFPLLLSISLNAQEKRKVDLQVEVLDPISDSTYFIGQPISFKVLMTNNGPDNLLVDDSIIFSFNKTQSFLLVLKDELLVGEQFYLFDREISTPESTGQFELCVSVFWDNELVSLDDAGTPLTSAWIDEVPGNNEGCAVINIAAKPSKVNEFEYSANNISIYPNPAKSDLSILVPNSYIGEYDLKIYSIAGKLVITDLITKKLASESLKVDVRALPLGIYYLQLNNADQSYNKKFTIQ